MLNLFKHRWHMYDIYVYDEADTFAVANISVEFFRVGLSIHTYVDACQQIIINTSGDRTSFNDLS